MIEAGQTETGYGNGPRVESGRCGSALELFRQFLLHNDGKAGKYKARRSIELYINLRDAGRHLNA